MTMELQKRPIRDHYSGQTGLMIQSVTCPRIHDLVTNQTMGPFRHQCFGCPQTQKARWRLPLFVSPFTPTHSHVVSRAQAPYA